MADWKQITARIRRARTSKDPTGQLSNLYEKTRDAMVAFELAKVFETSGQVADAAKWYAAAAERFRRADWKTKAQEAAARLGAAPGVVAMDLPTAPHAEESIPSPEPPPLVSMPEPGLTAEESAAALESAVAVSSEVQQASENRAAEPSVSTAAGTKHRRRGRRGGRNRRRGAGAREAADAPAPHVAEHAKPRSSGHVQEVEEPTPPRVVHSRAMPALPVEPIGEPGGPSVKGRYGDPGLSSRISLLEMQFRRLMACAPAKLSEADHAPAGPGVFVLTDSDLTSYYYAEACQTLRIAIGNLLRGGSSRRAADSIKPKLAEHLGIPESRVAKYLNEHCVVRWLQLDEGASHFAHFVIAVLRPSLNE